jgi:glycine/D-amino acid oxidase-like deaminating enzyme/nitrite reductase/ring-hydroxylating ferredoxin subunit
VPGSRPVDDLEVEVAGGSVQQVSPWVATLPSVNLGDTSMAPRHADVAVIGGGIAGVTTALLLQQAGRDVVLLEAGRVGYGVTTQSTVKVTVGHGTAYSQIDGQLGRQAAMAYAAANSAGMLAVLDLVTDLGIDCDLRIAPHVVYAEDDQSADRVRAEAELVAELGLPATLTANAPLPFAVTAALSFERQAQLHPGAYLMGLARAFVDAGGRIMEHSPVIRVEEADPCTVWTTSVQLSARDVVVATHFPILDRGGHFARLQAHRSYGIAAVLPDGVRAGMTIGAASGGFSTRTVDLDGEHLLVVVGASHLTGRTSDTVSRWTRLETWARERFGTGELRYRWSTQDLSSLDGMPYVGRITPGTDHVFTATGFGGWGMTNGTAAALQITDMVLGQDNLWADAFDARRLALHATGAKLVRQNAHVAKLWVKGRVVGAPRGSLADIRPGDAAVLEVDGKQTAACRDEDGTLHAVSSVCTHLGCTVAWNDGERSWDCPCHGSRFSPDGEVLHGPAVTPLERRHTGA